VWRSGGPSVKNSSHIPGKQQAWACPITLRVVVVAFVVVAVRARKGNVHQRGAFGAIDEAVSIDVVVRELAVSIEIRLVPAIAEKVVVSLVPAVFD
jgi:hypothetical protein